eukprot:gene12844-15079_t
MNNTFKSLAVYILAMIATVAFAAVSYDVDRFSNEKIVGLRNSIPTPGIYYQSAVAFNSTMISVFLYGGKYLIVPLADIVAATNDQTLSFPATSFNFKSDDSVFSVAQYTQDFIYAIGTYGLYKIRISDSLVISQGISTEGFGQTPFNSTFVNGNQFYFIGTYPPKMVRFTCDSQMPNDPNNPFKVVFSSVTLLFQPAAVTYDALNALSFIGAPNGELAVYDLISNTIVSLLANPVSKYDRQVGIVDPIKKELYTCSVGSNYSYTTASSITQINIPSSIPIVQVSSCSAAAIDVYQGQVLFVGPTGSSLIVTGFSTRGEIISAYIDNTSTLTTVTTTYVVSLSYTSTCTDNCNGHGQCIDNVCHCFEDYTIESFCAIRNCLALNSCSGNGACSNGTCDCSPLWMTSPDCSLRSCQSNCSGHGNCSMAPNFTCTCNDGFDCSYCQHITPIPTPTNSASTTGTPSPTPTPTPIPTPPPTAPTMGDSNSAHGIISLGLAVAVA